MLLSKSTFSKSKNLGNIPGEMTCSSGYIADASSARTPGQFLQKPLNNKDGRSLVGLTSHDNDDDDEEPTGFFGIMSEFQKGAGLLPSENTTTTNSNLRSAKKQIPAEKAMPRIESFNQSIQGNTIDTSRLMGGADFSVRETTSLKASFLKGTTINDISLDCSMPSEPKMHTSNFVGPSLELTDAGPSLELTQASPKLEMSRPQLDLTQNATVSSQNLGTSYNPLDVSVHRKLLEVLEIPVAQRHGYYRTNANVPQIRSNSTVQVGPTTFNIKECKG